MGFRKGRGSSVQKCFLAVCVILVLLALAILFRVAPPGGQAGVEREAFAMGTLVRVSVYGRREASLAEAANAALAEVSRLEELFSVYIDGSDIFRINSDPAKPGGHPVSRETYELLALALDVAEATGGAFDPTIGGPVRFWGIGAGNARIPSAAEDQEISEMLRAVDWSRIRLRETRAEDDSSQTIYLVSAGEGQQLDLGAIAKGYAADRAADILRECGVKSALIDIGGNLVAVGNSPKRRAWRLGLQDPFLPRGNFLAAVSVSDATIVTSGAYERFFEKDGVRYHHILDPKTGRPAISDLESVSIVMEHKGSGYSSARSDALSTALFVLGFDRAVGFLETHGEVQAVLVARKKGALSVYVTDGLKKNTTVSKGFFTRSGAAAQ